MKHLCSVWYTPRFDTVSPNSFAPPRHASRRFRRIRLTADNLSTSRAEAGEGVRVVWMATSITERYYRDTDTMGRS